MRLFENCGIYATYRTRLRRLSPDARTYEDHRRAFLADRYSSSHILEPVFDGDENAFFTNGDDEAIQRAWAAEHGMAADATLEQILLAQIEDHRTEVFYNLDPMRYGSAFVARLPGCVRTKIAWRAAPSPGADFVAYDRVLCNYPSVIEQWRAQGWKPAYFSPSHDPAMDPFAANVDRPIDVLFVGTFSRHHKRRAAILEAVATLADRHRVVFALEPSRLTRLAESMPGRLLPLGAHRRPRSIRRVTEPPTFGLDYYRILSQSRIVLNGAIDMSGPDRGNMRCWEAMGCRAMMVSDAGNYPEGMRDGETMRLYDTAEQAVSLIRESLADPSTLDRIARAGHGMIRTVYSKQAQWAAFQRIVASIA